MGTLTPQCLKDNPLVLVEDTPSLLRVEVSRNILTVTTPVLEHLFCGTVSILMYTSNRILAVQLHKCTWTL